MLVGEEEEGEPLEEEDDTDEQSEPCRDET